MTIKDLQKIISSATNVKIFVAKSKADADNEKYVSEYRMDVYSSISGLDDWKIEYIYPRAKDELEAWCIR